MVEWFVPNTGDLKQFDTTGITPVLFNQNLASYLTDAPKGDLVYLTELVPGPPPLYVLSTAIGPVPWTQNAVRLCGRPM